MTIGDHLESFRAVFNSASNLAFQQFWSKFWLKFMGSGNVMTKKDSLESFNKTGKLMKRFLILILWCKMQMMRTYPIRTMHEVKHKATKSL